MLAARPAEAQGAGDQRRRAMQAVVQPEHVESARRLAREVHRGFDGVTAADEEQRLRERRRQQTAEPLVQEQPRHVEHRVRGVDERARGLDDRSHHTRMVVAEGRAHLTGLEVEVTLARGVRDRRALAAREDRPLLEAGHVGGAGRGNHPAVDDLANPERVGCLHRGPPGSLVR